MTSIDEVLCSALEYAYEAGEAVVSQAMDKTGEGTEEGRARALEDLRTSFGLSWALFRQYFQV